MLLLSGYLLSSSIMALVAVTSPGIYPLTALFAASDLMSGRRLKFTLRMIYLILVLVLVFILVMLPIILLDMWCMELARGLAYCTVFLALFDLFCLYLYDHLFLFILSLVARL